MHVRRALALSLLTPLLLAGCSDGGEPEADPTPKMPETSSTTPSPSETEAVEEESPEEFIRRWQKASDQMQITGDTAPYEDLVASNCKACQTFIDSVQDIYSGGGSINFEGSEVESVFERDPKPPTFELTKNVPKTTIIRAGGAREVLPAGRTSQLVILKKDAGEWIVTYYGVL